MKTFNWLSQARRFLTDRILRLRETLEKLAYRLRDGIAATVGDAVAGIIRALLDETDRASVPGQNHRYDDWDEHEELPWDDNLEEYPGQEPRMSPAPEQTPSSRRPRWPQAIAFALQASTWLMPRSTQSPVATTLGIAALSGVVAYAGAPAISILVALAGSAISLVSLVDHAATEAEALAEAVNP
jgi:hypothetical protein